jgi:serine phosphatase RsbU (regulator of sigma subunit)
MLVARFALRTVLFVSLTVGTVGPLAYLGPTQIARWRDVQRQEADTELRTAAESLGWAVEQVVDDNVRALETTAQYIGARGTLSPGPLNEAIRIHRAAYTGCDGVLVTDMGGGALAAYPDDGAVGRNYRDTPFMQGALDADRVVISEVELGKVMRTPAIHVGIPIHFYAGSERGPVVGAIGAVLGLGHLAQLTHWAVDAFEDTKARVFDRHLRLILESDARAPSTLVDLSGLEVYRGAPRDGVELRDGRDETGRHSRVAIMQLQRRALHWTVAISRPTSSIEAQAARALSTTLLALSGALTLGVTIALILSSWLARPIRKLADYTARVASGLVVAPPSSARWDAREVGVLVSNIGTMVTQLQSQADALRIREAEQVLLGRLRKEIEIAQRIQSGILPKRFDLDGFEVAALMKSAEEVSGDYYEVIPTPTGCLIAVGDVCGHGVNAGLVMLMLQSALGALAIAAPSARPAELLKAANQLLVENVRNRLGGEDYMTLVLMHVAVDGRFVFAGAHEPILILRRAAAACELVETSGVWMGLGPIAEGSLPESSGTLAVGDMVVLFSDGIVERGASKRTPFGTERLCAIVERSRDRAPKSLCEEILLEAENWVPTAPEDDMTVLVLRYVGTSGHASSNRV